MDQDVHRQPKHSGRLGERFAAGRTLKPKVAEPTRYIRWIILIIRNEGSFPPAAPMPNAQDGALRRRAVRDMKGSCEGKPLQHHVPIGRTEEDLKGWVRHWLEK